MAKNLENLVAIVPARLGSNRVKAKNLRLLNGEPLITHVLRTLKRTQYLRNVTINSDHELFSRVATDAGVKFYQRPPELGTSASLIDEYIYDFICHANPEYLAVVNPTSPFIDAEQLDRACLQFAQSDCDTLLSCEKIQTHCFMQGVPLNFSTQGKHPRSQDIVPIHALNFAITIWDCAKFRDSYEKNGWGVYTGKLDFFETHGWASIDIDYPEDFALAEFVGEFLASGREMPPESYPDYAQAYFAKHPRFAN
jgi:CMP-N-acetylneuraminic acid synthetase